MIEPPVVTVQSVRSLDDPRVQRAIELDRQAYDAMAAQTRAVLDAHRRAMFDLYIVGRVDA